MTKQPPSKNFYRRFSAQSIRSQYFILALKSIAMTEMIVFMHILHQFDQLIKGVIWILDTRYRPFSKNRRAKLESLI